MSYPGSPTISHHCAPGGLPHRNSLNEMKQSTKNRDLWDGDYVRGGKKVEESVRLNFC
jgi:hypothetical protein